MTERPASAHPFRDFWVRLLSAAGIGVAFIGSTVFLGPLGLAAVVAFVAVAAAAEFYSILRRERRLPNELFGLAAVAAMPFAASLFGPYGLTAVVSLLVMASLLWHITFRQVRASDTAVTVFGAVYVGFTLAHLVLIRELDAGTELALATVASVWANDTFAYLIGSAIGKHRMAPHISPKKSWEGFAAGTLFTTAVWVAVYFLTDTNLTLFSLVCVGVAVLDRGRLVVALAEVTPLSARGAVMKDFCSAVCFRPRPGFLDARHHDPRLRS